MHTFEFIRKSVLTGILCISFSIAGRPAECGDPPPGSAVDRFFNKPSGNLPIYNGRQQERYELRTTNEPYFISPEYSPGTLSYEGVSYGDVRMRLDLNRNQLIVNPPDSPYNIVLDPDKVDFAELRSFRVVYHKPDGKKNSPAEGYYISHYARGEVVFLEKPYFIIHQEVGENEITRTYLNRYKYYILKQDAYHEIKSLNVLLKLLDVNRADANRVLSDADLDYKTDPVGSILAILNYYERNP